MTPELPKIKQTSLQLYVTAREAYDMWTAAPDTVKILDVRTPEEYLFIGHAPMAWNIPAFRQTYQWDPNTRHFAMVPDPDFMGKVTEVFNPADTVLVTCRSGGRSAFAVNQMAAAGYTHAYNITDGMEGDIVNDPSSVFHGKYMKSGWKNSGLPWTYEADPRMMRLPASR